jgi:hypothetical protein
LTLPPQPPHLGGRTSDGRFGRGNERDGGAQVPRGDAPLATRPDDARRRRATRARRARREDVVRRERISVESLRDDAAERGERRLRLDVDEARLAEAVDLDAQEACP